MHSPEDSFSNAIEIVLDVCFVDDCDGDGDGVATTGVIVVDVAIVVLAWIVLLFVFVFMFVFMFMLVWFLSVQPKTPETGVFLSFRVIPPVRMRHDVID